MLERLIYARVEPIIDPLLPQEHAGFWHEKTTIDQAQVTLLTQDIEDSFSTEKAGAVFVDITAAQDTIMASWIHLQVTAIVIWQAHCLHDHGARWQLELTSYYR